MTLASRLTAFFLTAVALLLLGFSATLYLLARSHMHRDLDERLANTLDLLATAAEDHPGRVVWKPGVLRTPGDARPRDDTTVRWAVFDGAGTRLDCGWGLVPEDIPAILDLMPDAGHSHHSYVGHDGRRWRVTLRRLEPAPSSPGDRDHDEEDAPAPRRAFRPARADSALLIVTGLPLGPVESSLRNVAIGLAGLAAGLWGLAAVAGRRFCRRALRPMTSMAAAAQAMSAVDPSHHLPSPGTGDELEGLAHAFNGLLDRLDEALEQQKRFAGDASHQLRTPLTALIGEIEVARRRDRSCDEYREALDEVHVEALRLRQIVESLLFLARAEAEAACPDLSRIDLAAWLPTHLDTWSAHERCCDIRADAMPAGPLAVRAHAPLLGQMLDNLLENACKYSDPDTPIRVRLAREPGGVALVVEDRGLGLSPEELPHVFEPFYRSPRARLRGDQGVGLGLSVVQRIATAFGATATVASAPGGGTRFVVSFPEAISTGSPSNLPSGRS